MECHGAFPRGGTAKGAERMTYYNRRLPELFGL